MIKYAKIVNQETGLCEVGIGTNINFYQSIGMTKLNVQQSDINGNWYLTDKCPMKTEEEKVQEERERLDALQLTPSDVERALYKTKKMDFDDLKALIAEKMPNIDLKGLAIEFRAKDFWRGATLEDGTRIFDVVGALLDFTPEDMDYLFKNKELPVKVVEPEPEETTEETVIEGDFNSGTTSDIKGEEPIGGNTAPVELEDI